MVTMSDIQSRRQAILAIADRYGARHVRVFGSVVDGSQKPDSDIDLLVDLEEDRSLLDQIALTNDLQDLLQCKVDVVDDQAVSPSLRQSILTQAVDL